MTFDSYYAVIMAGGGGTRLWPFSRQSHPKQMLTLFGERSLFQTAVDRLDGLFPPERIFVVTVSDQVEGLRAQVPEIPLGNYLIEPRPRGTASVVGLAAAALQRRAPDATMAILTADHFIADIARFQQALRAAHAVARQGHLVTLGIAPTFAATGYGYIHIGDPLGTFDGLNVHRVLGFKEKPDADTAQTFLASGAYAWNSGMFVWRVDAILTEIARQMPDLHRGVMEITAAWDSTGRQPHAAIQAVWQTLESQTVDYGIMEGAHQVAVIPAHGLGWSDVGSWDALFSVLPLDEDGNAVHRGQHIGLETHNTLLFNAEDRERLFVTIGIQDLVVVDTGDVLLVCHKDKAQQVRQIVGWLKEKDDRRYL
ncbi:MAG: mannose-1-phosphate guanylyltransferase [Anaerolineales bacterium]